MASGLPDWHRSVRLTGKFGTDYVPIVTDENGNLFAVFKGTDGVELRTVRVDTEGRMVALMTGGEGIPLAVDEEGRIRAVMQGEHDTTLRTLKTDEEGRLQAVMVGSYEGTPVPVATDADGRLRIVDLYQNSIMPDETEAQTWDYPIGSLLSNLNRIRYAIVHMSGEAWGTFSHSIAEIWGKFHPTTGHKHSGAADDGGVIDHGSLAGLGDDDHPQYLKKSANSDLDMNSHDIADVNTINADFGNIGLQWHTVILPSGSEDTGIAAAGWQDNFLAYADKKFTVSVIEGSISDLSKIFINHRYWGYIYVEDLPTTIEIQFPRTYGKYRFGWHALDNRAPTADGWEILVSDGGATWTTLERAYTSQNHGVTALVDGRYLDRVRFRFISPNSTAEGFGSMTISLLWGVNNGGMIDRAFLPLAGGDLYGDLDMQNHRVYGLPTPTSSSDAATKDYVDSTAIARPGMILAWSGSLGDIPSGWLLCDGTNGTPDLRDRFVVGAGSSYSLGDTGGEATHTLTVDEIPSHAHNYEKITSYGGSGFYETTGNIGAIWSSVSTTATGGGQAHENRPPYYALYFIMKA